MTGQPFELDLRALLAEEHHVRRLARGLLFDEHRVDDLVQQTWIAALRNPPREPGALRAWLGGVVRRLAANEVRGRVRRERRERAVAVPEDAVASVDEALAREERRREVVEALTALDEPFRSVVALRYLEGLEPIEIARRLGSPPATVRSWLRRGLDRMRGALDTRYGGDRGAWCAALLPLARGRDAATAGMATTLTVTGVLTVQKICFALALIVALAIAFVASRPDGAPSPLTGSAIGDGPSATASAVGLPSAPEAVTASPAERRDPVVTPEPIRRVAGVRGRLLDPAGQPLPAAAVDYVGLDGLALFRGVLPTAAQRTVTDAEGRFTFVGLEPRLRGVILADADGPLRQLVPVATNPDPGRDADLGDLRLDPRGAITGTVVDPEGEPVAGAEVWAADVPALALAAFPVDRLDPAHGALVMIPTPTAAECDVDGSAYMTRVRQHLAFRIVRDGFATAAAGDFVPVVVDAAALAPLWSLLPIARATTGADGTFRIAGAAPGTNLVVARHAAFANAIRAGVRVVTDEDRAAGTLRLGASRSARGVVVDADGVPVADAEVRVAVLALAGFRGIAPCEPAVRTGSDGAFVVPDLPRARICVAVRRDPGSPWIAVGPVDVDADHRLTLPPLHDVVLDVRDPRGALPQHCEVSVQPTPPLGELAAAGFVTAPTVIDVRRDDPSAMPHLRLADGVWTIRVAADGCAPVVRTVVVPTTAPVACRLRTVRELAVQVVDEDGDPVEGAQVFTFDADDITAQPVMMTSYGLPRFDGGLPVARATTDALGQAIVAVADAAARVAATDVHGRYAMRPIDADTATRLVLELGGVGTLVGELPRSAPDAVRAPRVRATHLGSGETHGAIPRTVTVAVGADGAFRIDDLPAGPYVVELLAELPVSFTMNGLMNFLGNAANPFGDDGSRADVRVEVRPGATTTVEFARDDAVPTGRVVGSVRVDGAPARDLTVWLRNRTREGTMTTDSGWEGRSRATIDAAGHFAIDDLPARLVWLGVRDGDAGEFLHVFEVTVRAGETLDVAADVVLGTVAGTLRDAEGRPVGGLELFARFGADERDVVRTVTTADDGSFTFARVPTGPGEVFGSNLVWWVESVPADVLPGSATPRLALVAQRQHRVVIRLVGSVPEGDGSLWLRFVDEHRGSWVQGVHEGEVRMSFRTGGRFALTLGRGLREFATTPAAIEVVGDETVVDVHVGTEIDRGR